MDLVEMQEWSKENQNYRYMLNVVDCFSKYAWSVPLLDKKAETVLNALEKIIETSHRKPKRLWVDEGKEFYNRKMDEFIRENNIVRYSTHGESKSVIVERFNRTLKANMWKRFTALNTRNWIDLLEKLMNDYNNKKHSTIKMKPIDASLIKNQSTVFGNMYRAMPHIKPKFDLGDSVRISRLKGVFEKGYLPNWSEELFTISEIKHTDPTTYIIKDSAGDIIEGSFYEQELQKSTQEIFRIEKIIQKKKIKGVEHVLVKWLGHSNKFNEWLPAKDLKLI
jgi:hypothetical protein